MTDQLKKANGNADQSWSQAQLAIREHASREKPRHDKMWAYYRNPIELVRSSGIAPATSRGWYRSAQEIGLPARIVGSAPGQPNPAGNERNRREVVIENDIGWRIGAMVDFMFGSPVRIESLADDPKTKQRIEDTLEHIWEASGGIAMLQDAATLGHVFGHVDLLVRIDEENLPSSHPQDAHRWISIEPIDARRGAPVLSPHDYRALDAYAVYTQRRDQTTDTDRATLISHNRRGWLDRLRADTHARENHHHNQSQSRARIHSEIFTPAGWARFIDDRRIDGGDWILTPGTVPVVHIQNMSQPLVYSGIGEVEPLVALQDELNTRLSDRASRVTMQSFKMYLAKGIDGFQGTSIGPGVVWSTDNPDADISSFGGDAASPSEDAHIAEIREAMDKISGVPPLAGGVVRAKLGNLSSANALRITLMSMIAKTMRKRITYGRGIERAGTMALDALHAAGALRTDPDQRGLRVVWGPLPVVDEQSTLAAGRAKLDLGVDAQRVLGELGYADRDPGIV